MLDHWKEARHAGQVQITALAYKAKASPSKETKSTPRKEARRSVSRKTEPVSSPSNVDPLKLEGPWECQECGLESPSANAVYRHVSTGHAARDLATLTVKHVATGRVYLDTALFRHVVTCGAEGCYKFAGRNKALTHAVEKLKHHWSNDHSDKRIEDFTFNNISLEHDDTTSASEDIAEEDVDMALDNDDIIQDASLSLPINPSEDCELIKLDKELYQQDFEGPFTCLVHGCEATVDFERAISIHYSKYHTDVPVKDVFFKNSKGRKLPLCHFYKSILQCDICNILRCSVQSVYTSKVSNKMDTHIMGDHRIVTEVQKHYTMLLKTTEDGIFIHPDLVSSVKGKSTTRRKSISKVHSTAKPTSGSGLKKTPASVSITPRPDLRKVKKVLDMNALTPTPAPARLSVSVAVSDEATSNTTFVSKGWRGPYHCLAPECGWVYQDTIHNATQRSLFNHWHSEHRDMRKMLFFDQPSGTVLNVKAILGNIGHCAHPACDHIIYGSKRGDFKNSVTAHWRRSHSDETIETVAKANLIKILSDIPIISNEEAQRLVSSLPQLKGTLFSADVEMKESPAEEKNDDEEDMEDQENDLDVFDGPYQCSKCDFTINFHFGYNRAMLQHWVTKHDPDPRRLVFTDTPTGRAVRAEALFDKVVRCAVQECGQVFGNNGPDFALKRRLRKHWATSHKGRSEVRDEDRMEVLVVRNVECEAKGCKWRQSKEECGWRQNCLNHFLKDHEFDLTQLRFRDVDGSSLQIQDMFSQVGQCAQEDCHMIRSSNSKDESELVEFFTEHYETHHPGLSPHTFTLLVENNEVKFVVEASCNPMVKEDVDIGASSLKCFECDKVLELSTAPSSVSPVQHWVKHGHNPLTLKVVRTEDDEVLNIKQLYKWIFRYYNEENCVWVHC